MRRPIIIGAQKLFLNLGDSVQFSRTLATSLDGKSLPFDVLISPSLINLANVAATLSGSQVYVGAQTFHQEDAGPFTGQVSLRELISLNIRHVLIGHPELRPYGETGGVVRHKIELCLKHRITPVICLGESRDDRKPGKPYQHLDRRIKSLFSDAAVNKYSADYVIMAYEPTWIPLSGDKAGLQLSAQMVNDACGSIRNILCGLFGPQTGEKIRILFGGGVNEGSVKTLLQGLQVDGLLIGRAGANIDSFLRILEVAEDSMRSSQKSKQSQIWA